jgi:DNA-binding CsgD family transcriptional regulator
MARSVSRWQVEVTILTTPDSADDRRTAPLDRASLPALLAATMDEIDYGLLLIVDGHDVVLANHTARIELDAHHPLELIGSKLNAKHHEDAAVLGGALAEVFRRGHRRLIMLGRSARCISMSIVPLPPAGALPTAWALALIGKPQVCQDLSVEAYARSHKLTQAETLVLKGLCHGATPAEIARNHKVAMSTVRTHVGSIRSKTSAPSIGALVRTISMLPPIIGALRQGVTAQIGPIPARVNAAH